MVLVQLKKTLELFVKRKEFLPGSRFLSHREEKLSFKTCSHISPSNILIQFMYRFIVISKSIKDKQTTTSEDRTRLQHSLDVTSSR